MFTLAECLTCCFFFLRTGRYNGSVFSTGMESHQPLSVAHQSRERTAVSTDCDTHTCSSHMHTYNMPRSVKLHHFKEYYILVSACLSPLCSILHHGARCLHDKLCFLPFRPFCMSASVSVYFCVRVAFVLHACLCPCLLQSRQRKPVSTCVHIAVNLISSLCDLS